MINNTIDGILKQLQKHELLALVKEMLAQQPDLELLVLAHSKRHTPVDPGVYREQVETAFSSTDADSYDLYNSKMLTSVKRSIDALLKRKEYDGAVVAYEVLIETVLEHLHELAQFEYDYNDEDTLGNLASFVNDCLENLATCLEAVTDNTALREKILRILFDTYRFGIETDGVEIRESVPDMVEEHATDKERALFAHWLYHAIKVLDSTDSRQSYKLQNYGRFLLDLQQEILDDNIYLRICRETGRYNDLIERLLKLGCVDEAIKETATLDHTHLVAVANIFVKHKLHDIIEQIMMQRAWRTDDTRLLEWLEKRFRARKSPMAKLLQAAISFFTYPKIETYREIRQLASQLQQWEILKPQIIATLRNSHRHSIPRDIFACIALDDGDVDELLVIMERDRSSASKYVSDGIFKIMKEVEKTQADTVIEVYRRYIQSQLDLRNRQGYQEASRRLVALRDLYKKLGQEAEWTHYITDLRTRTTTWRAFQEELEKAGL